MLIFINSFWVITRRGLHALMLKKHISCLIISSALAEIAWSPSLRNTQSPLIGQLPHTWASTANSDMAAVLNQLLPPELASWIKQTCASVMSQSRRIKGGTTDEAFEEQFFLWERGASVVVDFDLLHAQEPHHGSTISCVSGKRLFSYIIELNLYLSCFIWTQSNVHIPAPTNTHYTTSVDSPTAENTPQ